MGVRVAPGTPSYLNSFFFHTSDLESPSVLVSSRQIILSICYSCQQFVPFFVPVQNGERLLCAKSFHLLICRCSVTSFLLKPLRFCRYYRNVDFVVTDIECLPDLCTPKTTCALNVSEPFFCLYYCWRYDILSRIISRTTSNLYVLHITFHICCDAIMASRISVALVYERQRRRI